MQLLQWRKAPWLHVCNSRSKKLTIVPCRNKDHIRSQIVAQMPTPRTTRILLAAVTQMGTMIRVVLGDQANHQLHQVAPVPAHREALVPAIPLAHPLMLQGFWQSQARAVLGRWRFSSLVSLKAWDFASAASHTCRGLCTGSHACLPWTTSTFFK